VKAVLVNVNVPESELLDSSVAQPASKARNRFRIAILIMIDIHLWVQLDFNHDLNE
jgi:hypothetical protein